MKRKILIVALSLAAALWLGFIFSNSLDNGTASTEKSSSVTEFINSVVHALGYDGNISHKFVRKLAHFTEFFGLSFLFAADFSAIFYPAFLKKIFLCLAFQALSVPCSFICACADECIQLFSDGRAGQFTDVLIDTSGALCGYAVFAALSLVIAAILKKSVKKSVFIG